MNRFAWYTGSMCRIPVENLSALSMKVGVDPKKGYVRVVRTSKKWYIQPKYTSTSLKAMRVVQRFRSDRTLTIF